MILVTVGTHHAPFDRLIAAAEAHAAATGERVVVQTGPSRVPTPHCEAHSWLSPERLEALAREARAVVTHAGPGSVLLALGAGRTPIVVPRDPALGEHVDDHQLRFAAHLEGRARVVRDTTSLTEALESGTIEGTDQSETAVHEQQSRDFARRLAALIDEVTATGTPSCAVKLWRFATRGRAA